MLGNLHLTAKGARENMKRVREEFERNHSTTSTSNLSTLTASATGTALKAITGNAELMASKRSSNAKYRLHAAKYLKMDSMLKELMFPLNRFKGFFGYVQSSGGGLAVAVPATSDTIAKLAPRSSFRSVSFFKLRHTAPRYIAGYDGNPEPWVAPPAQQPEPTAEDQAKVLNAFRNVIGTTDFAVNNSGPTNTQPVQSYFRRFTNRPNLQTGAGAGGNPDTTPEGVMSMSSSPGNYKQLAIDFNCADIERCSLAQSPFQQSITPSTSVAQGTAITTVSGIDRWTSNAPYGPPTYQSEFDNAYNIQIPPFWRDATTRIADGKLSLDIQNGSRVPTVVEVVIHSMKHGGPSNSKDMNTKDIYEAIWKGANWQSGIKSMYTTPSITAPAQQDPYVGNAMQGGWQTFWDPKTPFLKVKGSGKKLVDEIANEVHRSIHYLAPGESKTVSIALGSLYYKLGHRSGFYDSTDTTNDGLTKVRTDGAGTLAVAVGAFGIDCLETAFGDGFDLTLAQTNAQTAYEGAGFWVGKRPAPSQIVVSGTYEEAWYPTYQSTGGRTIGDVAAAMPTTVSGGRAVPLGSIAPMQVNAIDDSSYFAPLGGGKAPPNKQGTGQP